MSRRILTLIGAAACALVAAAGALGQQAAPERKTQGASPHELLSMLADARSAGTDATPRPDPLPVRIPIQGVMLGVIDFSAHGVFEAATSQEPLTDPDWVAAGLGAINLIGASSLITLPGTGEHDAEWVVNPDWRRWARDLQDGGVAVARAVRGKDQAALLRAADRVADACQSCHLQFKPSLPPTSVTRQAGVSTSTGG